jgi:hypothetical protein
VHNQHFIKNEASFDVFKKAGMLHVKVSTISRSVIFKAKATPSLIIGKSCCLFIWHKMLELHRKYYLLEVLK